MKQNKNTPTQLICVGNKRFVILCMAQNKNALIRYKTIDLCLQNVYRNWTLDDLIEACSNALCEFEGKDANVSTRTVQSDIQIMRSDKLGYNSPIEVYEKKYYRYSEENYSITNIPITENDIQILTETVEILKQFKDFSLFTEVGDIIQKLEDKVFSEKSNRFPIIHLDKNENLKGLHLLDQLYQAIAKKVCLKLHYKSFKAREISIFQFHAYILKEYNNRWFLVGLKNEQNDIMNLALDRIEKIEYDLKIDYREMDFDGDAYFNNTIGVTVNSKTPPQNVFLWVNQTNAPYVITKPLHHSQEVINRNDKGEIILKIYVNHNFELERLILGFGNSIKVLGPTFLRRRINKIVSEAALQYKSKNIEGTHLDNYINNT